MLLGQNFCKQRETKLFTINIEFCSCFCCSSNKLVVRTVTKVHIAYGERVGELLASGLTPVSGPNFYTVLQPFIGDAFIIDSNLKGNSVFLLSIEIFKHGGDQNGCGKRTRNSKGLWLLDVGCYHCKSLQSLEEKVKLTANCQCSRDFVISAGEGVLC